MKQINKFIIEKLKLDSNDEIIGNGIDSNDKDTFFTCNIEDIDPDITETDILNKINTFDNGWPAFPWTGIRNKRTKMNFFWYAIYCYLLVVGPQKKKDIIQFLKPESTAQWAETFTALSRFNILSIGRGKDRGYWSANPVDEWRRL